MCILLCNKYTLCIDIFKVIELLYKRFIDCYDFIFIVIGILLYFRKKKIKKKSRIITTILGLWLCSLYWWFSLLITMY